MEVENWNIRKNVTPVQKDFPSDDICDFFNYFALQTALNNNKQSTNKHHQKNNNNNKKTH